MPTTEPKISCPRCGGECELPSGLQSFTCPFCDSSLFADRRQVITHYRVPSLLDRDQAAATLRRWMAGNDTVKDLDRKSELREIEAVSFPMWLYRSVEHGAETTQAIPAAAIPIPDLMDLELPAARLEPYEPPAGGLNEQPVTVSADAAREWFARSMQGELRETSLVRVPLWRCRYRYRDSEYLALVDANTGAVLASIFPEKAESPYLLVMALGFVLFLVEGLLIADPIGKAAIFMLTAIPLSGLAFWVAKRV